MIILRIWMVTIILDSSVNFRKLSSKVTKLDGTNLVTSVTSISTTHIWLQEYLLQVHRRISFVHNFGNRYSMITLLRVFLLVLVFSDYTQPRAQVYQKLPITLRAPHGACEVRVANVMTSCCWFFLRITRYKCL